MSVARSDRASVSQSAGEADPDVGADGAEPARAAAAIAAASRTRRTRVTPLL
jgi:hypothetical protein